MQKRPYLQISKNNLLNTKEIERFFGGRGHAPRALGQGTYLTPLIAGLVAGTVAGPVAGPYAGPHTGYISV